MIVAGKISGADLTLHTMGAQIQIQALLASTVAALCGRLAQEQVLEYALVHGEEILSPEMTITSLIERNLKENILTLVVKTHLDVSVEQIINTIKGALDRSGVEYNKIGLSFARLRPGCCDFRVDEAAWYRKLENDTTPVLAKKESTSSHPLIPDENKILRRY